MEEEIEKEYQKQKKIRKQESKNPIMDKANTKIFINVLIAVIIMACFVGLYVGHNFLTDNVFERVLQLSTMVALAASIVLFEVAYKKDDGMLAINGIEILVLACHALSIPYITTLFSLDFGWYVVISAYVFAIYFVFKAIVVYTKGRKDYVKSLSDIPEIIKEEEPTKKEAVKRKVDDND